MHGTMNLKLSKQIRASVLPNPFPNSFFIS